MTNMIAYYSGYVGSTLIAYSPSQNHLVRDISMGVDSMRVGRMHLQIRQSREANEESIKAPQRISCLALLEI